MTIKLFSGVNTEAISHSVNTYIREQIDAGATIDSINMETGLTGNANMGFDTIIIVSVVSSKPTMRQQMGLKE